jgi:putative transposase
LSFLRRFSPFVLFSAFLAAILTSFRSRAALQMELLALRHQLGVLQRSVKKPKLTEFDRRLWAWLSEASTDWRRVLVIVKR